MGIIAGRTELDFKKSMDEDREPSFCIQVLGSEL